VLLVGATIGAVTGTLVVGGLLMDLPVLVEVELDVERTADRACVDG